MKKITLLLSTIALLLTGSLEAQSAAINTTPDEVTSAESYAKMRAAAYATALGLDESETDRIAAVFLNGEKQVIDLRDQRAKLQTRIESVLAPFDSEVEKSLSKEQQAKLQRMRKEGTFDPGMASCAGHADAKGGACCAGKADAHAQPAKTPSLAPAAPSKR